MASTRTRAIDGVQGLVALVGITLGAIPLVRWIVQDEHGGLFRTLFGTHTGAMGYVAPILVIVAAVAVIALLEIPKRR
jgi:hypothetical protein